MPISLDYSYMLSPPVAHGVPVRELESGEAAFHTAQMRVRARRDAGELGFLDLPHDSSLVRDCEAAAARAFQVEDVVVLGIGGSALGTIALRTALLPPLWNMRSRDDRKGRPRLHVLDNVDPRSVCGLLELLALERTLVLVISKSGSTAETMSQYLIVRARLDAQLGPAARDHIVLITDPEKGALRELARSGNITALPVPPNVGGRFSVLSAVGILPCVLTGIDATALLRGAARMAERCDSDLLLRNPAALYAILQHLAHVQRGCGTHVFMPYADALRDFADWFVQLWAESLGKMTPDGEHTGPTPLAAIGATDQHSQVQLFMEGPIDKTITFIADQGPGPSCPIPADRTAGGGLEYLAGHDLAELLDAERRATAGALASRGRPSVTIELPEVDAAHVGELIMMLEIATVIAGELYGVNPLDQPGVELGKQFTYALMGREGSGKALAEWNSLPKPDPLRRV